MWFIVLIIIIKSLEYFFKNNLDLTHLTFKYVNVWVKNDSNPNQVKINYNDVKKFKNEIIIPDKSNLIQRYILKLKIKLIEQNFTKKEFYNKNVFRILRVSWIVYPILLYYFLPNSGDIDGITEVNGDYYYYSWYCESDYGYGNIRHENCEKDIWDNNPLSSDEITNFKTLGNRQSLYLHKYGLFYKFPIPSDFLERNLGGLYFIIVFFLGIFYYFKIKELFYKESDDVFNELLDVHVSGEKKEFSFKSYDKESTDYKMNLNILKIRLVKNVLSRRQRYLLSVIEKLEKSQKKYSFVEDEFV